MLKKLQIVLTTLMLTTVLGTPVFAENTDGYGNMNDTRVNTADYQGTHTNDYRGVNTTNYRTTATDDTYRRNNWGWIGLLGLAGLAGLRGRNRNPEPDRR